MNHSFSTVTHEFISDTRIKYAHILNASATGSKRWTREKSSEEAQNEQTADIRSECGWDLQKNKNGESDDVDWIAPKRR